MSLPKDYLRYPHRHRGMDHERYDWSILPRRPPVAWPGGARVALLIMPALECFPLDMEVGPISAPGALDRPYPDYWNYTLRDYGNRVGFFRVDRVLAERELPASVAISSALAERHPFLIEHINARGWEVVAHGIDMAHLQYGGLDERVEKEMVETCLATLRRRTGQAVTGWLSPGKSQSANTLDLIATHGVEYVCDWVNDDMPYAIKTSAGAIHSIPHPYEIDDLVILDGLKHSEDEFLEQIKDHFDALYRESSAENGRMLTLSIHPWVMGQPFRIQTLAQALDYILNNDGVWCATADKILAAFKGN